jgi:hypothetical protein
MDPILETLRIKQLKTDSFGKAGDVWIKEPKGERWKNQRNGNRVGSKRIVNFLKFSNEAHFEIKFD